MNGKLFVRALRLAGVLEIHLRRHEDERGSFMESYHQEEFERIGIRSRFVQDAESCSRKNVIRAFHFQRPPHAQAKLVRVIRGSIYDVIVDIRKSSPTYGQWESVLLENSAHMLWIPEGFAHGFRSLEEDTIVHYKLSAPYTPESEGGLLFNDPELGVDWGRPPFIVSEKDRRQSPLSQITPFE